MSTAIRTARYDADRQRLRIEFTTGREYEYANVPLDVYRDLTEAESAGRTFNREIRDQFPFHRLTA